MAASPSVGPARVVALLGLVVLAAAFFLPASSRVLGGPNLQGWDLAKGSFDLMRAVGAPDPRFNGTDMWKVYVMAYAWLANIGAGLALLACLMGWTQTKGFMLILAIASAVLGIMGVVQLFDKDSLGAAPIAWGAGLVDAVIACAMLPGARR